MSSDETLVFLTSITLLVVIGLKRWSCIATVTSLVATKGARTVAITAVTVPFVINTVVISLWSSADVRSDPAYFSFYVVMGGAWSALFTLVWEWLGLSLRDDVIERRSTAAALAVLGVYVSTATCFAGANIGNGPGWWVVVFCASLSTMTLVALWTVIAILSSAAKRITVDRDVATGIRVFVLFVCMGLVLGRAVAGDWISTTEAVVSFARLAWPALCLAVSELLVSRFVEPRPGEPPPSSLFAATLPAVVYGAVTAIALAAAGRW